MVAVSHNVVIGKVANQIGACGVGACYSQTSGNATSLHPAAPASLMKSMVFLTPPSRSNHPGSEVTFQNHISLLPLLMDCGRLTAAALYLVIGILEVWVLIGEPRIGDQGFEESAFCRLDCVGIFELM